MTTLVKGSDLKPGDAMVVWWGTHHDLIVRRQERSDPTPPCIAECFPEGHWFAHFATGVSMTIDNADFYEVVRAELPPAGSMRHFGSDRGLA